MFGTDIDNGTEPQWKSSYLIWVLFILRDGRKLNRKKMAKFERINGKVFGGAQDVNEASRAMFCQFLVNFSIIGALAGLRHETPYRHGIGQE